MPGAKGDQGDQGLPGVVDTSGAIAGQVPVFNGTAIIWVSMFPSLAMDAVSTQNLTVSTLMTPVVLGATGGKAPYTFSIFSGTLPDGLSLTSGQIEGTPAVGSDTNSPYAITLKVTDHVGQTATTDLTINVSA